MIPHANILAWSENAPWITDAQIEQDLVLSRILIEIFSDPFVRKELSFRGGTALHKLFFERPLLARHNLPYKQPFKIGATSEYDIFAAAAMVREKLIARLR